MKDNKERAKTIKKRLIDLDITQAEIARHLDIDRSTVNREIHLGKISNRVKNYLNHLFEKRNAA